MSEQTGSMTPTGTGPTIPTGTGPTIPTDATPTFIRGLALARAKSATSSAQQAVLTLAEIVLGQMNSTVPLDKIGEIRIKFEESATDVPIEFPGPGEVVILDTQGECVAIYRDPPGASFPCAKVSGIPG